MQARSLKFVILAALLSTVAVAQEGRLLFQLYSPGSGGTVAFSGFGRAVCTIGDADGDGWQDIAVGHPTSYPASSGSGRIQLVSGRDGTAIRACVSAQISHLGVAVAAAGDLDGDQVDDVLGLGGTSSGPTGGDVMVFSGSNAAVLLQLGVIATAIAAPGDWNGDLVPDVAYVAAGALHVASGVGGASITQPGTATAVVSVASTQPGTRRLAALSAGSVTLHASAGPPVWTASGYSRIADAGDLNGDQFGDVLAVTGSNVHVLSGFDGSVLLSVAVAGSAAIAGGVDLDGDQIVDFVTGDPGGRGFVRAYSGANGALLLEREGQEVSEQFGAAVAMHPGASATSRAALLLGVPRQFNGSSDNGALQVVAEAQPGEFDGSFRPFGQFCNFTNTHVRPGGGRPTIGQPYTFRFDNNTSPIGFEVLAYGLSNTTWAGGALPYTVPSILSCQLLVSPDALAPGNPFSPWASLTIPLDSGFVGLTLYVQGFNFTGYPVVESADAATIVIGN